MSKFRGTFVKKSSIFESDNQKSLGCCHFVASKRASAVVVSIIMADESSFVYLPVYNFEPCQLNVGEREEPKSCHALPGATLNQ